MIDLYINNGLSKLRCGYTTGTCAQAATKAAVYALKNRKELKNVNVKTPSSIELCIKIERTIITDEYVECYVTKDGGDDIDITNGIEIGVKVCKSEVFSLDGGAGVGRVCGDGLSIKKGQAAINETPRKMIKKEVMSILEGEDYSAKVIVFVPRGEEIAKKTFNERLSIMGGISILGTTGIVYPMSEDAIKKSIDIEIKQKAIKFKELVFVFGHIGEKFAKESGFYSENIVIISNYVGFALCSAKLHGAYKVTLIGHIGKLGKVALGIFNTHSRVSDGRLEVIALNMALLGYDVDFIKEILLKETTDAAIEALNIKDSNKANKVYEAIGQKVKFKCFQHLYNELNVEILMYSGISCPKLLWKSF